MDRRLHSLLAAAALTLSGAALANSADMVGDRGGAGDSALRGGAELPPYLQCVPYAREVSGIRIYGDAYTWWDQAEGRYARGQQPRVGAVLAFRPYGSMQLGHVAVVSKLIDRRTILLRHANWSPIAGRRGQIEDNVRAVDVSPGNDWSQVRVWYDPIQGLGTTAWPTFGFIYGKGQLAPFKPVTVAVASKPQVALQPQRVTAARPATPAPASAAVATPRPAPVPARSSGRFAAAFAGFDSPPAAAPGKAPAPRVAQTASRPPQAAAPRQAPLPQPRPAARRAPPADPYAAVIARYDN